MKAKVFFAGLLFAVIFFYSLSYSQVPQMINYQGKLTTPQGALIDTTVSMVFSIYADSEGTILLWEEEQTSMVVEKGIFDVLLGALNPLDDTVFEGGVRYLGVKVGDDPEMIPLKEMVSVAYAFRSEWADSTEFCYIESIYVHFIESDGDWDFSGDNIYRLIGNVGIGTDNPQEKLHVVGNAIMEGAEGKGNVWYTLKSNLGGNAGINLTSAGAGVNNWQIWRNGTSEDFQITETMPYPPGSIDAFIIKTDGDVGVGTTGPMAQLHVISDLMGETAVLGDGYVGVSGTGGWAGVVGSGALWGGYFDGDGYFSGKVGIGTTNPEVELHLSNNSPSDPNTTIRLHDFGVTFNKTVDLTVIA
ncbi:MAG: hypothetical protein KAX39_08450, partial [candidate division Zixibacteria bacterium]|nr:hypothetical protein [candidate division Zixibacteria bacterium]